jgi:hypothetical protein
MVMVTANSTGGSGGAGYNNASRPGGNSTSSAIGSNLGSGSVSVSSTANGGAGVPAYYSCPDCQTSGSPGGNAVSFASATSSNGYANSSATANGGAADYIPAIVSAHSQASGGAGTQANALITATNVHFNAQASVGFTGSGTGDTIVAIGQPAQTVSAAGKEAVAYGIAAPLVADVSRALAGHSAVDSNFHNGVDSQILLLGTMSVLNTSLASGLHDYHSLLNLDIDTGSIVDPQSILIGFLNPSWGANNFLNGNTDSLTFSYSVAGAGGSVSHSYVFNSANINDAANLFNDTTLNLGALTDIVTSTNKHLNLAFNLDLQTGVIGAGLNLGLIAGVTYTIPPTPPATVPLPAAIWLFASGLGLLTFTRRKNNNC